MNYGIENDATEYYNNSATISAYVLLGYKATRLRLVPSYPQNEWMNVDNIRTSESLVAFKRAIYITL